MSRFFDEVHLYIAQSNAEVRQREEERRTRSAELVLIVVIAVFVSMLFSPFPH